MIKRQDKGKFWRVTGVGGWVGGEGLVVEGPDVHLAGGGV